MAAQSLDLIMVAPRADMETVMTPDGIEYKIRGGFVKVHPGHARHFRGHGFRDWQPQGASEVQGPPKVAADAKPAEDLAESPVRVKAREDAAEVLGLSAPAPAAAPESPAKTGPARK